MIRHSRTIPWTCCTHQCRNIKLVIIFIVHGFSCALLRWVCLSVWYACKHVWFKAYVSKESVNISSSLSAFHHRYQDRWRCPSSGRHTDTPLDQYRMYNMWLIPNLCGNIISWKLMIISNFNLLKTYGTVFSMGDLSLYRITICKSIFTWKHHLPCIKSGTVYAT